MATADAPRQRSRVGGSVTAGSLAAAPPQMQQMPGSPSPRVKLMDCMMQQVPNPSFDLPRPHSANQLIRAEAPALRMTTTPPAAAQIRVEPAAARATTAPAAPQPAYNHHSLPEAPAPRSWTPSKLGTSSGGASGSTTRSLTPAEALEREMQELSHVDPSPAAAVAAQQRPHSSSGARITSYKNPYFISESSQAAGEHASMTARPASSGSTPLMAQHNNLMTAGFAGSTRPGSGSRHSIEEYLPAHLGLGKLKDKLVGSSTEPSSTAVEAFSEPTSPGVAGSDCNDPVVVARRKCAAPPRLQPSSYSRSTAQWEQEAMALLNTGDRLAALQLPGPSSGVVRCFIKRSSNLLGFGQHFELRLESTDECLAVARRRVKSTTSSYIIGLSSSSCSSGSSTPSGSPSHHEGGSSSSSSSLRRDDPEVVGKLKANMMGTEYLLRGRGGDGTLHKGFNKQLLAVNYNPTINHIHAAPRTMTAVLPVPDSRAWDGSQPLGGQFDSLTACMEAARERQLPPTYERDLVMLHTMKPHYDPVKEVYYLDFKGRVREVSLKNFQLVHWDHNRNQLGTDLVLLFGKKEHSEYAVDFCYPMNALQAFALGLSSIDTKLCYAV